MSGVKELLEGLQIQEGQKPPPAVKGRRLVFARTMLLAAGVLVLGMGVWSWRFKLSDAVEVEVFTVAPSAATGLTQPTLKAGGYVKDPTIVYVVPRIPGRIESVLVKEGDQVRAGDVVARLDTRDLLKEVDEAHANLLQAKASLSNLRAGSRPEEIEGMKARAAAALHQKEKALRDVQRTKPLLEAGAISAQEFDRVNTEYLVAERNSQAAAQSLAVLEAGARKEEIQMAEAALQSSLARFEAASNRLSYAEVRAPISGRVLRKYRETGDRVSPEVPFVQSYDTIAVGSPVVAIAALEDQEVSADINETDLSKIALNQPVEIVPNAFPGEQFMGTVTRVAPRADKNKNTIEVRATFDKGARKLPHDMSVKLTFAGRLIEPKRTRLQIPSKALRQHSGRSFVYVVNNSRAALRPVEAAGVEGEMVVILRGVTQGDRVIVSGAAELRDGSPIKLK